MKYKSYQHVDRLGRQDCEGVLDGKAYVQPKIDGTNCCIWIDDAKEHLCYGSRSKQLSFEDDNRDFCKTIDASKCKDGLLKYLKEHANYIIYGEWLVPHTLRYYKPDVWNKFYIFDVLCVDGYKEDGAPYGHYINYDEYSNELQSYLEECDDIVQIIPLLAVLDDPSKEDIEGLLKQNKYLLPEDSDKIGEGIVIKNYDYRNKYGRAIWGKIVAEEFFGTKRKLRTKNHDVKSQQFEEKIANSYISEPVIRKEFAKVLEQLNISSPKEIYREQRGKVVGMTLQFVFDAFLHDDLVTVVKKNKNCVIDFNVMKRCSDDRVKEVLKDELF